MKRTATILVLLLLGMSVCAEPEVQFRLLVEFPLDEKGDTEDHHMSIRYGILDSGEYFNVRLVWNWANQNQRKGPLSPSQLERIHTLLAGLPESAVELPKQETVRIWSPSGPKRITHVYACTNMPTELEEVITLLGGLQPDIRDKVKYIDSNNRSELTVDPLRDSTEAQP